MNITTGGIECVDGIAKEPWRVNRICNGRAFQVTVADDGCPDQLNTEGDIVIEDMSGNFGQSNAIQELEYSATGLPNFLIMDGDTGTIAGSPAPGTAAGSPYAITVTAEDQFGNSAQCSFEWTIQAP